MEEIEKAVELALREFHKKFGEDAKPEEGDEFATVFNNCVLIISFENNEIGIKFVGGTPFRVDMALSIYN